MAGFPIYRPRRLRVTENLRSMIRETSLSVKDLIFPLFVVPGSNVKNEIETLKNNYQWSVDRVMEAVDEAVAAGIPAVLLFGLPSYKDEEGSSAWDDNEPVQMASKAIKAKSGTGRDYRRLLLRIYYARPLRHSDRRLLLGR